MKIKDNTNLRDSLNPKNLRNFYEIEQNINLLLNQGFDEVKANSNFYQKMFDRICEEGFYGTEKLKGKGEMPTWKPNPAYMESLEFMWLKVDKYLQKIGLTTDSTLRELFKFSREYKDSKFVHRRVFIGQLIEDKSQVGVTLFMLSVPHSHQCFKYSFAPYINISGA